MDAALTDFFERSQLEACVGFLSALSRALLAVEVEKRGATFARKVCTIIGSTIMAFIVAHFIKQIGSAPKWASFGAAVAIGILAQHLMMRIVTRSEDIMDAVEQSVRKKLGTDNQKKE